MMLTVPTAMLGELVSAHATINYDTLPADGMGQAQLDLHLEGNDDTLTLELGTMPEAATTAAEILRALADELDEEAARYEHVPEHWDGFVGLDRGDWGAILDGKALDLPPGVSEAGAIVALALECRESGYYPTLWIDRYVRGGYVQITPETLANAAAEVLDIGALETSHCEHCAAVIEKAEDGWTHPELGPNYGHLASPASPLCHVYNGWELEDGEEATTATPEETFPTDKVRALLDEVSP